jgi:hypothetical protein
MMMVFAFVIYQRAYLETTVCVYISKQGYNKIPELRAMLQRESQNS